MPKRSWWCKDCVQQAAKNIDSETEQNENESDEVELFPLMVG